LGDEPPHARFARGGQQPVSPLRPKPVRLRETTVEVLEVPQIRKSGRLMDDGVRFGFENGRTDGSSVEQIERDRFRPERPYPFSVSGRVEGADHLVPTIDQLGNEPGADGATRASDENSHRGVLSVCLSHIARISRV
jgi:hypothetical protein